MSDVTTKHADYLANIAKWTRVEDAASGEDAVKDKTIDYLPRPNPSDTSKANASRYSQYLLRAVFYGATGRTLTGLIGLAFKLAPTVSLPPAIKVLQEDVSGSGLPIIQHAQATLAGVLKTGRGGILADYPKAEAPISKADENRGDVRPTMSYYPATAITNWRTAQRAGKTILSMVVLQEQYEEFDGFGAKAKTQYRVLKLDPLYMVEIWRELKDVVSGVTEWRIFDALSPIRGDGKPWEEITFTFVGAQNNDWTVDTAPLYDLAVVNLAHYRNSADYEDSVYLLGQPQIWMAGLDQTWVEMLEEKGVYFGSRAPMPLPVGGTAGILQAAPNTLAKEAMQSKEEQMSALGARLIIAGTGAKTATQQESEDTVAHSVLSLACENVSSAYVVALNWCATFTNVAGQCEFKIPKDFTATLLSPEKIANAIQLVQAGLMPKADLFAMLRNAGYIDAEKTDDVIREEIDAEPPSAASTLGGVDSKQVPGSGQAKE